MIDFKKNSFKMLHKADKTPQEINSLLTMGENVVGTYMGVTDCIVFTTKRIIAIGGERLVAKKKDYTSLPYSKIQVFSVETAKGFDLDTELELYFSGLGKVKFGFTRTTDILEVGGIISQYTL